MGVVRLHELYQRDAPTLSVEFFPPKTEQGERRLLQEIEALSVIRPAFCSVTYGAGGSTRDKTLDVVNRLTHERGLNVMCHLTVVNQSRSQVCSVLHRLRDMGVPNLLALAGDPPPGEEWTPHPEGFRYARELVELALGPEFSDWFSVAVAGFPEVHPRASSREADLRYLKEKVDAGASVVITQLFFDNTSYFRFVEDARRIGIEVPIVPGILPIQSAAQVRRFARLCGARIPPRLDRLLDLVADDDAGAIRLGVDYATEQCAELLRFGVPGFHFYSLNRAHSVTQIHERLTWPDSP